MEMWLGKPLPGLFIPGLESAGSVCAWALSVGWLSEEQSEREVEAGSKPVNHRPGPDS